MSTRKTIITGAMALGLLAGSAGIASALSSGRQTDPAFDSTVVGGTAADAAVEANDAAEGSEADDALEPALNGSIQVPDDESVSETDESSTLAGLATMSESDATKAALDANPGATLVGVKLENDNGSVLFEVTLTDAAGATIEVKVDAGNGAVLAQEAGDDDGDDEADGIDHENDGEETGENGDGVADADDANEAPEASTTN